MADLSVWLDRMGHVGKWNRTENTRAFWAFFDLIEDLKV